MRSARLVSVLWFLGAAVGFCQQYTISTFAGGGPQPPAPSVLSVAAVATDVAGNVSFSSVYYNSCVCVFKLDTRGKLTLLAGGPQRGFSGDGGPASKAQL